MKKNILKDIRAITARLPFQFTEGKTYMKGSAINEMNAHAAYKARQPIQRAKDKDGNELDPDKLYSIDIQVPVNHTRRVKRIFAAHGLDGVRQYVEDVIKAHKESQHSHAKVLSEMPVQPMSI